jgi:3-oxoacyl-[acyl-carrier protein] reductase
LKLPELDGRVALVTGASRGIGKAIALSLASAGAAVAVHYRSGRQQANEVVAGIREKGGRACAFQGDLADTAPVVPMIQEISSSLGPVDILVNNAGVAIVKAWPEINLEDWDHTYQVNVRSEFMVCREVVPGMRERRWGRLIFISSVAAHTGGVIGPHYASSKAAQIGLMHSYANLLVKEGITSNAISPALIETDMLPHVVRQGPPPLPVGRFGLAGEVAQVALMLATNGFITGQTIQVNGGWYFT